MATVAKFPDVPYEIWPTTVAERRRWVEAYWSRSDPAFVDGAGAECFLDFIARAQAFLGGLSDHPAQNIAVFSHGQVINAVAWLIERKPQQIDDRAMADCREFEILSHVPNCGGYTKTKPAEDTHWRASISMPEERGEARPER